MTGALNKLGNIGAVKIPTQDRLITCIMPTHNRRLYVPKAIEYFLRQDYTNSELLIIDDGEDCVRDIIPSHQRIRYIYLGAKLSLGEKRNLACDEARGEIILHWDDDDWSAAHRIRSQVEVLQGCGVDICGMSEMIFFQPAQQRAWRYRYPRQNNIQLLAGGSLCYTKRFWSTNRFLALDVGEDTQFIWNDYPKKLVSLSDLTLYVAITHNTNTNQRRTETKRWKPCSRNKVHRIMGPDIAFYNEPGSKETACQSPTTIMPAHTKPAISSSRQARQPRVSCIMPTRNRGHFVRQSIEYFNRQDYPLKELLIADDGNSDLSELTVNHHHIRYIRLTKPTSVGEKHNIAVQHASGELIAHWDDNDWYAPDRLSYQVAELLRNHVDICGLESGLFFDVIKQQFWRCSAMLQSKMFYAGINGRSLLYRRKIWERRAKYPDISLGEDAQFLKQALAQNASLQKLANDNKLINIRHNDNTWQFVCGRYLHPEAWQAISRKIEALATDEPFYRELGKGSGLGLRMSYALELDRSKNKREKFGVL